MSSQSLCVRFNQSARCKNTQEGKQHEQQEAEGRAWELKEGNHDLKNCCQLSMQLSCQWMKKKTVNNDVSCPGSCSTHHTATFI
jgi:hypothetical protein